MMNAFRTTGRRSRDVALLLATLAGAVGAQTRRPDAPVAFVSVNVVPMNGAGVLRDQRVIVEHGRIAAIGASAAVPPGAEVVDGHGTAFLAPGLADMHSHADTRDDLAVYLANGVTTVLNMGDASYGFIAQLRPAVNAGRIPGPHVYAAFVVDGTPEYGHFVVTTPAEARAVVGLARTNGYDFIKVYNNLTLECFYALIDEARRYGVKIVGHGVTRVGLERQLAAGQILVAHTEEFLYTVFPHSDDAAADAPPDPARIPRVVAMVKRDSAFVTADLGSYETLARQWGRPAVVARMLETRDAAYVAPEWRASWRRADYARRTGSIAGRARFLARFTKALGDAGVPLVTGTDAPTIPGIAPGASLHDDLDALRCAGLSTYQVLLAATRTPGELIRRSLPGAAPFGTVAVGQRADLVLTTANPLDDLTTLRRPLGVMASGQWYDATALAELLERVARNRAMKEDSTASQDPAAEREPPAMPATPCAEHR